MGRMTSSGKKRRALSAPRGHQSSPSLSSASGTLDSSTSSGPQQPLASVDAPMPEALPPSEMMEDSDEDQRMADASATNDELSNEESVDESDPILPHGRIPHPAVRDQLFDLRTPPRSRAIIDLDAPQQGGPVGQDRSRSRDRVTREATANITPALVALESLTEESSSSLASGYKTPPNPNAGAQQSPSGPRPTPSIGGSPQTQTSPTGPKPVPQMRTLHPSPREVMELNSSGGFHFESTQLRTPNTMFSLAPARQRIQEDSRSAGYSLRLPYMALLPSAMTLFPFRQHGRGHTTCRVAHRFIYNRILMADARSSGGFLPSRI